jgi:hypothetical protein
VLRTDIGGELCGNEFDHLWKQCGITQKTTTPYTPQQYGVVEIMNRTLMNKERNMLSGARLTQEFWEEVFDVEKYILHMSPSSALVNMTPHEVCLGNKPLVSHLKVFSCDEFFHVPEENRSKVDKKEVKCIFIGYKEGMKIDKIWDPASRKIMYNRDVVFIEFRSKSKPEEIVQTKNNLKMVWFELRNEKFDSNELSKSEEEVEQMTQL